MEVANITSNSEELTPADISSTTAVLDLLTELAITDPEVRCIIMTLYCMVLTMFIRHISPI